jgi:hypothetical protein
MRFFLVSSGTYRILRIEEMIEHQVAVLRRKSEVGHGSYREILPDVIALKSRRPQFALTAEPCTPRCKVALYNIQTALQPRPTCG